MMNNFESEYPFGDFLEDTKFYELSEYLQSHWQNKNTVNDMSEGSIFMHDLIFSCGWETKSLHTIFSSNLVFLSNDTRCVNTLAHWFLKGFKWDLQGCSSNPRWYTNITWESEVFCRWSVCQQKSDHKQHEVDEDYCCFCYDTSWRMSCYYWEQTVW